MFLTFCLFVSASPFVLYGYLIWNTVNALIDLIDLISNYTGPYGDLWCWRLSRRSFACDDYRVIMLTVGNQRWPVNPIMHQHGAADWRHGGPETDGVRPHQRKTTSSSRAHATHIDFGNKISEHLHLLTVWCTESLSLFPQVRSQPTSSVHRENSSFQSGTCYSTAAAVTMQRG